MPIGVGCELQVNLGVLYQIFSQAHSQSWLLKVPKAVDFKVGAQGFSSGALMSSYLLGKRRLQSKCKVVVFVVALG